ncbi:hypothetical protein WN990_33260 [Kitasatospora purpeofusca]|uniref:hypothetical protein n=1 Tax=Kitasatospora purpeofusca TaxID=67352 RepID=UPI0030F33212
MVENPKLPGHFVPDTHGVSDPLLLQRRADRAHWQNTQAYQREHLGRRANLREVFGHETELSRWIASNLAEVARCTGIVRGLRLVDREYQAGRGRIDVLAAVGRTAIPVSTPAYVVIENQLTSSDDDHLARLIKYAAVIGAQHAVWIAPAFSDDHVDTICRLTGDTRCSFTALRLVAELAADGRPSVVLEPVADFAALRVERRGPDALQRDGSWAHHLSPRTALQETEDPPRGVISPWFKPPREPHRPVDPRGHGRDHRRRAAPGAG